MHDSASESLSLLPMSVLNMVLGQRPSRVIAKPEKWVFEKLSSNRILIYL